MNWYDHLGLWGSIASIIGLPIAFLGLLIAFLQIRASKQRIARIENHLKIELDFDCAANSVAQSTAVGGVQSANQSVTQSLAAGQHTGPHPVKCSFLPNQDVYLSVQPANGLTIRAACSKLSQQDNHTCEAEQNRGKNCIFIDPRFIKPRPPVDMAELQRNARACRDRSYGV